MTHTVYLGIGSNIDAHHNIAVGLDEVSGLLSVFAISSVYRSEAVGFSGDDFLNLVVGTKTDLTLEELAGMLRSIEFMHGREPDCSKFSSRKLDIDVLTYDDLVGEFGGNVLPRPETTRNAFVLRPFSEIAPTLVLPNQALSLADLWRQYEEDQRISPEPFCWQGKAI